MSNTWYVLLPKRNLKLIFLLMIIPLCSIYAFLHEFGHVLFCYINGWEVYGIHIPFIPFDNAYTYLDFPSDVSDFMLICLYLSGSFFTFIIGSLFLFLALRRKNNPIIQMFFILYGFLLILDIFMYNFADCFFIQYGDWYEIYQINPNINGYCFLFGIILLILLRKYYKVIKEDTSELMDQMIEEEEILFEKIDN